MVSLNQILKYYIRDVKNHEDKSKNYTDKSKFAIYLKMNYANLDEAFKTWQLKTISLKRYEFEDLCQDFMLEVVKAMQSNLYGDGLQERIEQRAIDKYKYETRNKRNQPIMVELTEDIVDNTNNFMEDWIDMYTIIMGGKLTELERTVFIKHVFEGKSMSALEIELGKTRKTLKKHYDSAISKFKVLMEVA